MCPLACTATIFFRDHDDWFNANVLQRSFVPSMSDSFADLWNTSAPLPAKPKPQALTLAARLAEENHKRHRATVGVQSHKAPDVSHEAWAGLDSLESGMKVKVDDNDDWGLRDFGSAVPNPTTSSSAKTLWDLDDFSSSTQSTPPPPPPPASSYMKPQSRPISRSTSRLSHHSSSQQKVDSPDMDFDFGLREDREDEDISIPTRTRALKSSGIVNLLDDDDDDDHMMGGIGNGDQGFLRGTGGLDDRITTASHDEDEEDILGVLSKPVEVVAKQVFISSFFLSFFFFTLRR